MNIPRSTELLAAMTVQHMRHEWLKRDDGTSYADKARELAADFERRGSKYGGAAREAYEQVAAALRAELNR